jgi:hypothetical protein
MSKKMFSVGVRLTAEEKAVLQKMGASSDSEALRILIHEHAQGEQVEERIARAIEPLTEKIDALEAGMREAVFSEVKKLVELFQETL